MMTHFFRTYIADAPWRFILLFGLMIMVIVGGLNILVAYKTTGEYFSGKWYGDLIVWFITGMFIKYVTWSAEGYLERKNKRWKNKRERKSIK